MQELPWLQEPVPPDGQFEKSQTLPQAPQLNGSVLVLVQTLSQAVPCGGLQVSQTPTEQMSFEPHAMPQPPQLSGSNARSTQLSPQSVWPGQIGWQLPPPQNSSAAHVTPHAPQ